MKNFYATETLPFQASSDINVFWTIIKIVLYLVFIGVLAFLIRWILKRKDKVIEGELIQILGSKTIAPSKYIQIVEVIDRILIIGVGENINILSEIKDKEEIDLIKTEISKDQIKRRENFSFREFLSKKVDFIENERNRLKAIEK